MTVLVPKQVQEGVLTEEVLDPWNDEPDTYDFTHMGYECNAVRNFIGVWCGFVRLPISHPWCNMPYEEIPVNVHGGLSFSGHREGSHQGIDSDFFWVGFDCARAGDYVPGVRAFEKKMFPKIEGGPDVSAYKNLQFVIVQTMELAAQARFAWAKANP